MDLGFECVGDPPVNVLEEAVQGGIDDTLEFAFRWKFHPQAAQPLARGIKQGVGRLGFPRTVIAKPVF